MTNLREEFGQETSEICGQKICRVKRGAWFCANKKTCPEHDKSLKKEEWRERLFKQFGDSGLPDILWMHIERDDMERFIENELQKAKEVPYNISEWKRIGEERGYWDYFENAQSK